MLDVFWLLIGFVSFVRIKRWYLFLKLILKVKKPGVKAAILDMILLEVFVTLQKKHQPDFSYIFFNGSAHIQHHYLFNSIVYDGEHNNPDWYCPKDWDPFLMILKIYDKIIIDLLETDKKIIGLTGLHQVPHIKQTFYWRPENHRSFLNKIFGNISYSVVPRMSRDFLVEFTNENDALQCEKILCSYTDSEHNDLVFNVDNRGNSLFVEIVYSHDINSNLSFKSNMSTEIKNLRNKLSFVAIKNGEHNEKGYLFSNEKVKLDNNIELKEVYSYIKESL